MGIKSILCIFGGSEQELDALNAAMALAKSCSAWLRILHISPDPGSYVKLYGGEVMVVGAVITAIEMKNAKALAMAKQHVTAFAERHQIPLDGPETPAHHASARFQHQLGIMEAIIPAEGRLADLIILSREVDSANIYNGAVLIEALFNTGRPVLFMPKTSGGQPRPWQDSTIGMAWDGSLEAARALKNAMPLLTQAENFHVLTARLHGQAANPASEIRLMEYLKAHGLKTEIIAVDHGHRGAGEIVLEQATELKCDLLVMGAYGHSRYREMLLGGFTDYMLQNANIPLLLSH